MLHDLLLPCFLDDGEQGQRAIVFPSGQIRARLPRRVVERDKAELTFISVLRAASYCPWAQDFRASSIPGSILAAGVASSAILLFSSVATQKNRGGVAMRRCGRVDRSIGGRLSSRATRKNHNSRLENRSAELIVQSALFTIHTENKHRNMHGLSSRLVSLVVGDVQCSRLRDSSCGVWGSNLGRDAKPFWTVAPTSQSFCWPT